MENTNRVVIELTNKDMFALYNYIRLNGTIPLGKRLNQAIMLFLIMLLVSLMMNIGDMKSFLETMLICTLVIAVIFGLRVVPEIIHKFTIGHTEKSFMKKSAAELQIEGTRNYIIGDDGIEVKTSYGDLKIRWDEIAGFEESEDYLFFITSDDKGAHAIPFKFFPSKEKRDLFVNKFAEYIAKAQKK